MSEGYVGTGIVHHVGIVVHDLDAAIAHHERLHGSRVLVRAHLRDQGVEAAALALPGGGAEVELIAPTGDTATGVSRFLERRGEGLHHLAYEVDDVAAALEQLRGQGVRLVDETPRTGLHGVPVAFAHPVGMNGVLTELVQRNTPIQTGAG